MKTFDAHDDKVLGLHANRRDNALVTGSADSRVLLWKIQPTQMPDLKTTIIIWLICFMFFFFFFTLYLVVLIKIR